MLIGLLLANTLGVPVIVAAVAWLAFGLLGIAALDRWERALLTRRDARQPSRLEHERLAAVLGRPPLEVLVCDAGEPILVRTYRHVVVGRALLDLLEDRALLGLLAQAMHPRWSASLAGELLVWSAVGPLGGVWLAVGWLMQLGRGLAALLSWCLVLPLVLFPDSFVHWVGRLLGAAIITLLGMLLVASGLSTAGLLLWLGTVVVPGLQAVLAWEYRRTEELTERDTIELGLGGHLAEALEELTWYETLPRPAGVLSLFAREGSPIVKRAERTWRRAIAP